MSAKRGYEVERGRVTYAGKTVRGAEPESFRVLDGDWARDGAAIYHSGRKLQRIAAERFVMLSPTVGTDGRKFFYTRGASSVIHAQRPKDLEVSSAVVLGADEQTFLVTGRGAWVLTDYSVVDLVERAGAEPGTFVALNRSYAKDAHRAFWFDAVGRPKVLVADAETFVVDASGARDKDGPFYGDARGGGVLAAELVTDPAAAADAAALALWQQLWPCFFARFDAEQPTDTALVDPPMPSERATPLPTHGVRCERGWIVVEIEGTSRRGRASAMELLAGWLWGIARGKSSGGSTVIRLLPNADDEIAREEGDPPPWEQTLNLAHLLDRAGERDEARLLMQRVLRLHRSRHRKPEFNPDARAERLLPTVFASRREEVSAKGTTTHSALRWLIDNGLPTAEDPLVRWSTAQEFQNIVRQTSSATARLFEVSGPVLVLLDDKEPAVASSAAVAFDALCQRLFNHQDYEEALALADVLGAHGFNLDLQQARRWECLSALGRDDEAALAWNAVQTLTGPAERAPRQYGMHTDYSSWAVWRAFAELRLVRAHRWMAQGKATSEERRARNRAPTTSFDAKELTLRARARAQAAAKQVEAWIESAPSRFIGPMLAEFATEYARATGVGRIEGVKFVTHRQIVDYRRYSQPYLYERAAIDGAGLFERIGEKRYRFERGERRIVAALERAFGIDYRFFGRPVGRMLPARVLVTRPRKEGGTVAVEYPTLIFLGLRETFVWRFEAEDELVPGDWQIEVELFDADPAVYPSTTLVPNERIGHLQQAFVVVAN
jgi:hypothetical protein